MTVSDRHEQVKSRFLDAFGDRLRAVFVVSLDEGTTYDKVFFRDDVDEMYGEREFDRIASEMVYHGTEKPYQEDLYEIGELRYTTQRFDDAVLILFPEPDSEHHSTIVSVAGDTVGDSLHAVADDCADLLGV